MTNIFEDLPAMFGSPLPKGGLMVSVGKSVDGKNIGHNLSMMMMSFVFVVC